MEHKEHSGCVDGGQAGLVDLGDVTSGQSNPVLQARLPELTVTLLDGRRREVDAKTPDLGIQSAEHAQERPVAAPQIEHALVAVGDNDVVHHGKKQQILHFAAAARHEIRPAVQVPAVDLFFPQQRLQRMENFAISVADFQPPAHYFDDAAPFFGQRIARAIPLEHAQAVEGFAQRLEHGRLQVRPRREFVDIHAGLLLHFVYQPDVEQRVHGGGLKIAANHFVPSRAVGFLQTQHVGQAESVNGFG